MHPVRIRLLIQLQVKAPQQVGQQEANLSVSKTTEEKPSKFLENTTREISTHCLPMQFLTPILNGCIPSL